MLIAGLLLFNVTIAVSAAEDSEAAKLKLGGYYKNLLLHSKTVFPEGESYGADLNRLRLEVEGKPLSWAAFDIQYDNEVLFGNYLRTSQFALQKNQEPDTYWDLQSTTLDRPSVFARQRLYRGYLDLYSPVADVRLGRQRIAWGTGRFWNPTDILNPFDPTQLERDERPGVDAVLAERKLGALSKVSLVYAPQRPSSTSSTAAQVHTNFRETDVSIMGGQFHRDEVAGFDFAGRIGQVGIRGEAAYTHAHVGESYTRAVLGADYVFPNTFALSAELYYNGQGTTDKQAYDFPALFAGTVQNLAQHYGGVYVGYDITPLLRLNTYGILNLDDGSVFVYPSLVYSLITNLDLTLGMQLFAGAKGSEYGAFHNVYFAQLQWFF
jgi:hypothetical protein